LPTTGTFRIVGAPVVNGLKLAMDDLNAKNFFGSTKVNVLYEDNRSDKQEALSLLTRMANRDNVLMFIGPVSSGEAMAVAPGGHGAQGADVHDGNDPRGAQDRSRTSSSRLRRRSRPWFRWRSTSPQR
jgi:hypothetical protein